MPHWVGSKRLLFWAVGLAAAATLLLAWHTGWPRPLEAVDERQHRLDVAAALPTDGLALEQGFVAQHDGLTAVELLLVVYPSENEDEERPSVLTLRLLDPAGNQLYTSSWDAGTLTHNDPLRFVFPPLFHSAGQRYRLQLEGTAANRATVWAYSLDGYSRGELTLDGERQPGDLRFQTVYRYSLPAAWRDLRQITFEQRRLFLPLALLLFLPGLALLPWLPLPGRDSAVRLGIALAGSLVCLPLGWLWLTQLGGRWSGPLLWLALGGTGILLIMHWRRRQGQLRLRLGWETAVLGAILLLSLSVRFLAIRDLVLPAWVDSPQHFIISRMMADSGTVPVGYRPWMPVDVFWYHFGFHALAASVNQMTGLPLEQILLAGGQILNALAPLSVYTGTVLLTGRRPAGLIAAFFVGLLSLFPAYYVTWGRCTQLAGMLILPPFMGITYRFLAAVGFCQTSHHGDTEDTEFLQSFSLCSPCLRGKKPWLWLGLVFGGLFLVHARVWVFAMVWAPVAAVGLWLSGRRPKGGLGRLAVVGGIAAACALPWLLRVGRQVLLPISQRIGQGGGTNGYNDIPWGYLTFGWERAWLALAAVGLLWALWRRRRPVVLLGGWVAAVFLLINVDQLGLPAVWLVNNNTWFISLYAPVGMILGWSLDDWLRLAGRRPLSRLLAYSGLTAAVVWSGLFGLRQMVGIVNPETVLARPDDLAMLEWAETHLPADALVAVNAWTWLGESNWAGSDGGYWLLLLTGRQITMPPIGYGMEKENRELVNEFNRRLAEVEDWNSPETLDLLRGRGVTHILIGERGGALRPEKLLPSSHYRLLETNGAAWLFQVSY